MGERVHRGIARGVYGGLGLGLRGASRALDGLAARHAGPSLDADPRGRNLSSAVNGLIGDRLLRERPQLAIPMAVRHDGRDVVLDRAGLAEAFPAPPDGSWSSCTASARTSPTGSAIATGTARRTPSSWPPTGWTPVLLRANTGLPLRENGVALAALLHDLVDGWPVPVERIALVGHSLGGLVMRAAAAVTTEADRPWTSLVTDVVTLGTPHLGAPLAAQVATGSRLLGRLPESAAFGRILDWRSTGVLDLVEGLAEDVPALPHARYRLVAGTVTASPRHPLGAWAGDGLVRTPSAYGRARGVDLFPGAELLHVPGRGPLRPAQPPAGRRGAARLAGLRAGSAPCEIRCARTGAPPPWK